jgi:hypothetical protein
VGRAADVYAPPSADDVKARTLEWLAERRVTDPQLVKQIAALWADDDSPKTAAELFERVIETYSLADEKTRRFVRECTLTDAPLVPPEPALLSADNLNVHHASNLRLFYARYLTRRRMYEEALQIFEQIDPVYVVDPATHFYFKAVCQHQLLRKQDGLATIGVLLEQTEDVPVRYASVAKLMKFDLESLKEKSLDQIARRMQDSERRLDLGRGGRKAQKVQDEIIADLDEIIKKLEQQQGGGGGGGSGKSGGRSNRPGSPANDSVIKGSTAPGLVDEKKLKNQGGWGNLGSKAEERARNDIFRNYPANYYKQVEAYMKKLAKRRARTQR